MTVKDFMRMVDARIMKSKVVRDVLIVGTEPIEGAFWSSAREVIFAEGSVEHVALSFDCQHQDILDSLEPDEHVTIEGRGTYRFLRMTPEGGDESGLVTIILGEVRS